MHINGLKLIGVPPTFVTVIDTAAHFLPTPGLKTAESPTGTGSTSLVTFTDNFEVFASAPTFVVTSPRWPEPSRSDAGADDAAASLDAAPADVAGADDDTGAAADVAALGVCAAAFEDTAALGGADALDADDEPSTLVHAPTDNVTPTAPTRPHPRFKSMTIPPGSTGSRPRDNS